MNNEFEKTKDEFVTPASEYTALPDEFNRGSGTRTDSSEPDVAIVSRRRLKLRRSFYWLAAALSAVILIYGSSLLYDDPDPWDIYPSGSGSGGEYNRPTSGGSYTDFDSPTDTPAPTPTGGSIFDEDRDIITAQTYWKLTRATVNDTYDTSTVLSEEAFTDGDYLTIIEYLNKTELTVKIVTDDTENEMTFYPNTGTDNYQYYGFGEHSFEYHLSIDGTELLLTYVSGKDGNYDPETYFRYYTQVDAL